MEMDQRIYRTALAYRIQGVIKIAYRNFTDRLNGAIRGDNDTELSVVQFLEYIYETLSYDILRSTVHQELFRDGGTLWARPSTRQIPWVSRVLPQSAQLREAVRALLETGF